MDMLKGLKAQNTVFGGSDSKQKLRTMMTNGVKTASCRNTSEHTIKKTLHIAHLPFGFQDLTYVKKSTRGNMRFAGLTPP